MRLVILSLLPLLMISSTGKDIMLITPLTEAAHSLYIASGDETKQLIGKMSFVILSRTTSYKDEKFKVLKLNFISEGLKEPYAMEILISKINKTKDISLGTYKVEDIESFLRPFEGVFGAFSSVELGNKPFFATGGVVNLTHINASRLVGKLDLEFKDNSGKKFSITGGFDAK